MPIDPSFPFASEGRKKPSEEDTAFTAWKATPNPQTSAAFLTAAKPILDTALTTYGGGAPSPTLRGRAKILALDAMGSYDPKKGNIRTHLISQLQSLRRFANAERQPISIPEQVFFQRGALSAAETTLEDRLGRQATTSELARHLGISTKRLGYIRKAHVPVNTGAVTDLDGEVSEPASVIPGNPAGIAAWREFVHRDLDPVNQTILEHTFGMFGRGILTTNELAKRLGISAGAISQRKAKIQAMLEEGGAAGFGG